MRSFFSSQAAVLLLLRSLVGAVIFSPLQDTFVIQKDGRSVGHLDTLDLYDDTHVAYLRFDLEPIRQHVKGDWPPLDIVLRFAINWSPHIGSRVELRIATFENDTNWNEAALDYKTAKAAALSPILYGGVTFVTRNSWVEFDLRKELLTTLEQCKEKQDDDQCRFITFQLSTPEGFWVKVYSKDASTPDYRPRLIIHESPHALAIPTVSDAGIVKQMKNRGFGWWPTLDLMRGTHVAFMEFDLADILHKMHVSSIDASSRIKLRVYTQWAQGGYSSVQLQVVDLATPIDENTFVWDDGMGGIRKQRLSEKGVSTGHYTDFDLTDILTTAAHSRSAQSSKTQDKLQLLLTTKHDSWVKLASKEYPVVSQRPSVIFVVDTWWDWVEPVFVVLWSIYCYLYVPLHPIFCGVGLALLLHYSRKIILPFLIPFVINVVKSYEHAGLHGVFISFLSCLNPFSLLHAAFFAKAAADPKTLSVTLGPKNSGTSGTCATTPDRTLKSGNSIRGLSKSHSAGSLARHMLILDTPSPSCREKTRSPAESQEL